MRPAIRTLCAILASVLAESAAAQAFPSRPVRVIVPYGTGGTADLLARAVAPKAGELLGQPLVIENRPGAGGNLGAEVVARSPADGHALLFTATGLASAKSLYRKLGFDPLADFAPVVQVASIPNILVVHPSVPAQSVRDLVVHAKAHPGKLSFASAGVGTSNHLAAELFKVTAGVDILHIPYKSAGQAMPELVSGQVQMIVDIMPSTLPQVRNGRLRALAVTSPRRSPAVPDLPTVAESGLPDYQFVAWLGVFAPAGTPGDVVSRLNAALLAALQAADMREKLSQQGAEVATNSPQEFAAFFRGEVEKWARVVREARIPVAE